MADGRERGSVCVRERHSGKTPKTENSNVHGFEVHRPSSKGTKLLLQIIKAIINHTYSHERSICV